MNETHEESVRGMPEHLLKLARLVIEAADEERNIAEETAPSLMHACVLDCSGTIEEAKRFHISGVYFGVEGETLRVRSAGLYKVRPKTPVIKTTIQEAEDQLWADQEATAAEEQRRMSGSNPIAQTLKDLDFAVDRAIRQRTAIHSLRRALQELLDDDNTTAWDSPGLNAAQEHARSALEATAQETSA